MTNSGDSTELDDRSRVGASHVPTRAGGPQESTDDSAERTSAPHGKPPRWIRPALFLLLPILLIAGAYWYVSGGQMTSMEDAYVEADKVDVSTDVSGIVKEVDVAEKVVQRIPLRVRVDTTHADLPPLRAGMSVEVDTGHRRGLPHFLTGFVVHAGRAQ
jgi:multidrug resistance efflux pump